MRRRFTKMHGAGNDFVVLDATREAFDLDAAEIRRLADRRLGVGADQVLVVEPPRGGGADFRYRIFNGASGDEVGQCGNGARCVARFVLDRGLSTKARLRVETTSAAIELRIEPDGAVSVDMGAPVFEAHRVPFDAAGLVPREHDGFALWPIEIESRRIEISALSMGNPHAVLLVDDVDSAPVASLGPAIESHPRFPSKTNVGFAQIVSRTRLRLRVFERDAGETPACGSGACAAVVAGIRLGLVDARVEVETRGGMLAIAWPGALAGVVMSGPAETVFEGEIDL